MLTDQFAQDDADTGANIEHISTAEQRASRVIGKIVDEMLKDSNIVGVDPSSAKGLEEGSIDVEKGCSCFAVGRAAQEWK